MGLSNAERQQRWREKRTDEVERLRAENERLQARAEFAEAQRDELRKLLVEARRDNGR